MFDSFYAHVKENRHSYIGSSLTNILTKAKLKVSTGQFKGKINRFPVISDNRMAMMLKSIYAFFKLLFFSFIDDFDTVLK